MGDYIDVTPVSQDKQSRAHRMILSAKHCKNGQNAFIMKYCQKSNNVRIEILPRYS